MLHGFRKESEFRRDATLECLRSGRSAGWKCKLALDRLLGGESHEVDHEKQKEVSKDLLVIPDPKVGDGGSNHCNHEEAPRVQGKVKGRILQ